MPIMLTALGTVTALNTATIGSQVTGLLISLDFNEGQLVKKGELIAQIDPRTFQAQVDQAEATLGHDQAALKNAQLNLERYRGLANANSIARQQFEDQQATVEETRPDALGPHPALVEQNHQRREDGDLQCARDLLQRWPVSKRVNSSKADADDPTLIEAVRAIAQ
jgi:multidrug efflux pump subunit AcrA (membrane-fusion protein)